MKNFVTRLRAKTRYRVLQELGCGPYWRDSIVELGMGSQNGVQVQIYATGVFYAVLLDLCQEVAQALAQPLERISVEMVFGSFYHHSVAYQRGNYDDIVRFLADHAKLLGIVKRKRHKLTSEQNILIWGVAYVVTYAHASPYRSFSHVFEHRDL